MQRYRIAGLFGAGAMTLGTLLFCIPASADQPLVLETQGHFWVGGEVVDSLWPQASPGRFGPAVGHTVANANFVEFWIPMVKQKNAGVPIVFVPGGGLSGLIYQMTPDRREGWNFFFVRQGFPVYIVTPAGRERAGYPIDHYNGCRQGDEDFPCDEQPVLQRWTDSSWVGFSVGPEPGVAAERDEGAGEACPNRARKDPTDPDSPFENPPDCGGNQWPPGEEAFFNYMAQISAQLPLTGPFGGGELRTGLIELLEDIGPAVIIAHSSGGAAVQTLANTRPDLFKALITVEPAPFQCRGVLGGADLTNFATIPYLNLLGEFGRNTTCVPLIDALNAIPGGDAQQLVLDDVGIFGNSHIMMQELNSDKIAKTMSDWIRDHVDGD